GRPPVRLATATATARARLRLYEGRAGPPLVVPEGWAGQPLPSLALDVQAAVVEEKGGPFRMRTVACRLPGPTRCSFGSSLPRSVRAVFGSPKRPWCPDD